MHTSAGCTAAPFPATTHCSAPHVQLSNSFPTMDTGGEQVQAGGDTSEADCACAGGDRKATRATAARHASEPATTASGQER